LMGINALMSNGGLSYFDVSSLATGGAPLAIAATGQTLGILTGGFVLFSRAVISLGHAILAKKKQDTPASIVTWALLGVGVGMAAGAFNGIFIAFLRLQPIVVTLSTMFIVQGLTLLVMDKPGGMIPAGLSTALAQDAVPNLIPMAL